jgi:cell wall-associated NlpC family hydrolase
LSVHRSRYRRARRRGSLTPVQAGAALAAGVALAAAVHAGNRGATAGDAALAAVQKAPDQAAAKAVGYARARVGDSYLWGGTGPGAYDCSGLAMEAWASAGVPIERTAAEQWASEARVSNPQAGDLVFFPGSDGTWSSPGHVGIVVDPARHLMIDAYGTGYGIRYDTYGSAASPDTGLSAVIGFTDPQLQAGAS